MHWMDVARRGVQLARQAAAEGGRAGECAVAFSLNGDVDTPEGAETIRLLARVFEDDPPDIVLLETLSLVRADDLRHRRAPARHRPARVAQLPPLPQRRLRRLRRALGRARGRRLRPGGAPLRADGRRRAARQLHPARPRGRDDLVDARLHRPAARRLPEPRLPLDRRLAHRGRASAAPSTPRMALAWREEGAQIVGGCCGVGPEHVAAAREALAGTAARPRAAARARRRRGRRGRAAGRRAGRAVDGRPRLVALSARLPRHPVRAGRLRAHPGQLPGVEVPVPRGHRPRPPLPRRRLRHRPADRAARPERRRARARDRRRPAGRAEHAHERVPKRRRRPRQRRGGRPLPVGAGGALRRDRGEPLPAAGRPVRARRRPTGRSTTGAAT